LGKLREDTTTAKLALTNTFRVYWNPKPFWGVRLKAAEMKFRSIVSSGESSGKRERKVREE